VLCHPLEPLSSLSAQGALARCMADGECLENLVCLQLCNGKPDESACQVRPLFDAVEKDGDCRLLLLYVWNA
jgi:hypothetical protein